MKSAPIPLESLLKFKAKQLSYKSFTIVVNQVNPDLGKVWLSAIQNIQAKLLAFFVFPIKDVYALNIILIQQAQLLK